MRVVYVTGAGHIGSTILDIVLGNHPHMQGVGEVSKVHRSGWVVGSRRRCACGSLVAECAFWPRVRARWAAVVGGDDVDRYVYLQGLFERYRMAWPRLLWNSLRPSPDFEEYLHKTQALYEAIRDVSGREIIVDSSLTPRRAYALTLNRKIDLSLIHLVRDGRGVIWSLMKPNKKTLTKVYKPAPSWRTTKYWVSANLQSAWVFSRVSQEKRKRIRYEDFVTNPSMILKGIGALVGEDMSSLAEDVANHRPSERATPWVARAFACPRTSSSSRTSPGRICSPPGTEGSSGCSPAGLLSGTATRNSPADRPTRPPSTSSHHLLTAQLVDKWRPRSMAKEILCTLGPASLDPRIINRLEQSGATLFRINLSHTKVRDLPRLIEKIRSATEIPICLDTEGAQIRTGDLVDGSITMRDNTIVRAHARRVPGDDKNFSLYPAGITEQLEVGDFISIDFNSVLVQVIAIEDDFVSMRVLHGGHVGQNKAVTVERDIPIPPLSEKDEAALELGCELGLRHFALSFANAGSDVEHIRRYVGEDAFVISKIESLSGLANLEEIASHSNALLIDRGDLSRQVPVELLPQTQKCVIHRAKRVGCSVYVATNLLESMVSAPTPTRAEVNDIYNTLADGADGLVLAAETAIGQFPIQCVSMVSKMIRGAEREEGNEKDFYPVDAVSLLVEPHGGRLVRREATPRDLLELEQLPRLGVSERDLMDCEQLANGTYSPLAGFMDRHTLESVLAANRLPEGEIWTLPILLQIDDRREPAFSTSDRIALTYDGEVHALLDVSEIYDYDLEKLAIGIYGTASIDHPGVARVMSGGRRFIAGDVTLVQPLASPHRHYLLTPAQSRFVFTQLGWSQVVGFHGRNPAHRGHEFIQAQALERTGADGLYINPVIGPKKKGDFLPGPILLSYQTLLEFGCYPKGKAVLGSFFTYSRYAGPREAVFTALCRKNMGCSHFIVGRDHSGVGRFYEADANRKLFDSLGDLGVEPIFFDTVGYNARSGALEVDRGQPLEMISGTEVREILRAEKRLPDWFMRELVQEVLIAEIRNGNPVFYDS